MGRVDLDALGLSAGKKARLHRILYQFGPGNGVALLLPYDQGLEHGPRDFFNNPDSADPRYLLRLAVEGGYSGVVFQTGIAKKYYHEFAGRIPLVVKLNGKTDIPSDEEAFSPVHTTVEEAVALGADAVGYTMYVGSPAQDRDFVQFGRVRAEADRLGVPIIVWAYPRGRAVEARGGQLTSYAIEYAARVAAELGADMVKVNVPRYQEDKNRMTPKPYSEMQFSEEEAVRRIVWAAGRTPVIISGGAMVSEEEVLAKAEVSLRAGASGLIFGRNVWQRPYPDAIRISRRIRQLMEETARG